ncbi:hypothetical protein EIP91_003861 [Steccherinum ochraceum]|uniref:Uncharacterized protein n=1 Tax=Steccherinum ochraceum TaxID=92696 RepID=A0A4R0RC99_9APHY|nr:hypothetical protein EIP91_003861 [Steccherinum ochraceum]
MSQPPAPPPNVTPEVMQMAFAYLAQAQAQGYGGMPFGILPQVSAGFPSSSVPGQQPVMAPPSQFPSSQQPLPPPTSSAPIASTNSQPVAQSSLPSGEQPIAMPPHPDVSDPAGSAVTIAGQTSALSTHPLASTSRHQDLSVPITVRGSRSMAARPENFIHTMLPAMHGSTDAQVVRAGLDTRTANQARYASYSTTRPAGGGTNPRRRNAGLGRSTSSRVASAPASLPPALPTALRCYEDAIIRGDHGQHQLRTAFVIHPPQENNSAHRPLFVAQYTETLERYGLIVYMDLDLGERTATVLEQVANKLETCGHGIQFTSSCQLDTLRGTTRTPRLTLLGLRNKGRAGASGQRWLQPLSPNDEVTIGAMLKKDRGMQGSFHFDPKSLIRSDRLWFQCTPSIYPLKLRLPGNADDRVHSCVSIRIDGLYPRNPGDRATDIGDDACEDLCFLDEESSDMDIDMPESSDDEDWHPRTSALHSRSVARSSSRVQAMRPRPPASNSSSLTTHASHGASSSEAHMGMVQSTSQSVAGLSRATRSHRSRPFGEAMSGPRSSRRPPSRLRVEEPARVLDPEAHGGASPIEIDSDSSPSSPSRPSAPPIPASQPLAPLGSASRRRQGAVLPPQVYLLPGAIWLEPFVPEDCPVRFTSIHGFKTQVFHQASLGFRRPKLEINASSVRGCAEHLLAILFQAAKDNDFSDILNPNRSFTVELAPSGSDSDTVSYGDGVEEDTLYVAFKIFIHGATSEYFLARDGGFYSLRTLYSTSSVAAISEERLTDLTVLGALCALLIIYGRPPEFLTPLLFQYIAHDFNLHSLTPEFVALWHPDVRRALLEWKAAGANGNVDTPGLRAHFASYHDMEITCHRRRNEAGHQAIAAEMLSRSILGPERFDHPELQAFVTGFKLKTQNDFNFCKALRSFAGGPMDLLNNVFTAHVVNYSAIQPSVHLVVDNNLEAALQEACPGSPSLKTLVEQALMRDGIPCPTLFKTEVAGAVDSLVDLSTIDKEGFRIRHFLWASTGSPHLGAGATLQIQLADYDHTVYTVLDELHGRYVKDHNKILFRTCMKQATIPARHIIHLAQTTFDASSECSSLEKALDHWILGESLLAIGQHSIA